MEDCEILPAEIYCSYTMDEFRNMRKRNKFKFKQTQNQKNHQQLQNRKK